ncbi:CapA family protein [Nostocaceae cyanobacterium CENA369]|uniref:CapA family protein n=1 Tax=Dendronalium phyllosphericum CENA369 TaxID=1725256 RepID=A0A8J7I584_9NOST|nr:CapA family protein [Dendronalium phyllosphericum]MBH8574263.1 CapA family protein [Dendronalium phyllosphericum CENA369]
MANQKMVQLLGLGFVTGCFCLGIGIGVFIRFGQLQPSDAATSSTELEPIPFAVPEPGPLGEEQTFPNTITIKAVGDIIPSTNFPNYREPRFQKQLLPKSVKGYLQGTDILFGNFESSLTNYPYTTKDVIREQVFGFRSPLTYAKLFTEAGFNAFN